jgi:hypothetical protein
MSALPLLADRVLQTSSTTGTGTWTLDGAAPSGWWNFADLFADQAIVPYVAKLGANVEIGIGIFTLSGTTLSRDLVLASTNSNNKVNFAGDQSIWVDLPSSLIGFDGTDGIEYYRRTADSTGWSISVKKSRGSFSAPSVITTGDELAALKGLGYVGGTNTYVEAGSIKLVSEGTISDANNGIGGKMTINLRAAGGAISNQLTLDSKGNLVLGNAAINTNATDGFLYVTSMAGTPSGTPTSFSGRVPLVIDSTNNAIYYYNGTWRSVGGVGGGTPTSLGLVLALNPPLTI